MAKGQSGRRKLVPECHQAIDQWKYEIAAELGIPVGKAGITNANTEFASELGSASVSSNHEDYWGHIATRDAGAVGGHITKRLIEQAEKALFSL